MIVYKIINKLNDHYYVGSTKNFRSRKSGHLWSLRRNKHHSIVLQRAWDKYGEENFVIVEWSTHLTIDEMLAAEQALIADAHYNACSSVYKVSNNGIVINQFTIEGEFIKEWESAAAASRELGLNSSDIVQSCKGKKYRIGSFYFAYKENPIPRKKEITTEDIAKRNASNRARTYVVTYPNGKEEIVVGLKKFCKEHNLRYLDAHAVVLGTRGRKSHKGHKFRKYEEP